MYGLFTKSCALLASDSEVASSLNWYGLGMANTNTVVVLCISWGYLITSIVTLNIRVLLLQNYDPTSLQINRKPYHYTCASSIAMNTIHHTTLEMLYDIAVFFIGYKNHCTCCSLTF